MPDVASRQRLHNYTASHAAGQTQTIVNPYALCRYERDYCTGTRKSEADQTPMKSKTLEYQGGWIGITEKMQYGIRRTITRMFRRTCRPTAEQMQTLPIHAKHLPPLYLERLTSLMNAPTRERFTQVWELLINPTNDAPITTIPLVAPTCLSKKDVCILWGCCTYVPRARLCQPALKI